MTPLAAVLVAAVTLARPAPIPVAGFLVPEARCLDAAEQRQANAERRIVPLADVRRTVRSRMPGDIVDVRLCDLGHGLVYVLTVLARDGKVGRLTIDAASGRVLAVH